MDALFSRRMTRAEYRQWAEGRPGHTELVRGEVVHMAAERVIHARLKSRMWDLFRRELAAAALPCEALPDGMTVEVDDDTDYEPDAMIHCGPPLGDDVIAPSNPVVVVEVLSPNTGRTDLGDKLDDYFRVASIMHYLIVLPRKRRVIHHRRAAASIETRILDAGTIRLDPPGIALDVAEIFTP